MRLLIDAYISVKREIMNNFDDYENKSYQKADDLKIPTSERLAIIFNLIVTIIKVLAVTISETVKSFIKLFLPPQLKDISGQLALITGSKKIK
jgi:hypothetical protein